MRLSHLSEHSEIELEAFIYNGQPSRIVFGAGSLAHLEREAVLLGAKRILVMSTPPQADRAQRIADQLGARAAGIFPHAVMHVPTEVVRDALDEVNRTMADCIVAFGGGSSIGLGKAVALRLGLPVLAIPTTYAGSEMTPIYGITDAGLKHTGRDSRVLPRTVIYDPTLTLTLSVDLSVTSGMNAIAHAAEGLYAQDSNPITTLMAEEGIRALASALPAIRRDVADMKARTLAQYGAWLSGSVLGSVGMALHHKLCHALGGSFNLPHAAVHTVILPHAIGFNAPAAPQAMASIARALGISQRASAAAGLYDLAKENGAPLSLRAIGMSEQDLDRAADIAVSKPYWNPRALNREQRDDIRWLLQCAFDGVRPA